jgi:hypothetical protein
MNKSLILSIGRKYFALLLVVGSLIFIASSNTNSVVASKTRSGSVITFLTPKRPTAQAPTVASKTRSGSVITFLTPKRPTAQAPTWAANNNVVPSTSAQSTSVNNYSNASSNAPITAPAAPQSVAPAVQNSTSPDAPVVPPDVVAPPSPPIDYDPDMPYPPVSGCGTCGQQYDQKAPHMMCPQYMACMY